MADDIDIEEHDVMDNPKIKDIFPDITNIKTEVVDYDEEDQTEQGINEEYQPYEDDSPPMDDESNNYILGEHQNKLIVGTKPCSTSSDSYESDDSRESLPEIRESSVVLQDWGVILAGNPCFCGSCNILFPTVNALDAHKMMAHSFLVAVGANKAVKSTAKSHDFVPKFSIDNTEVPGRNNKAVKSTSKSFDSVRNNKAVKSTSRSHDSISPVKMERLEGDTKDIVCGHCNEVFPDEIALIKHSYELHLPGKFQCGFCHVVFENEMALKAHESTHASNMYRQCIICSCLFRSARYMSNHLKRHKIYNSNVFKVVVHNNKCKFCKRPMRNINSYNIHIKKCHPHEYNEVSRDEDFYRSKRKLVPYNSAGQSVEIPGNSTHNIQRMPGNAISDSPIVKPVPKSVLFKCNKCQIHFVMCGDAVEHSQKCILQKGDWKCQICRYSFKQSDRLIHLRQHQTSGRFKVIKLSENIHNVVLYKCSKCKVSFNEPALMKYHSEKCSSNETVDCSYCNLTLLDSCIENHTSLHVDLDLKMSDFIIVNFECCSIEMPAVTKVDNGSRKIGARKIRKLDHNRLYYCPTCKCFMKVNKSSDRHCDGECSPKQKFLCRICGLQFSVKSSETHKRDHKIHANFKLRNMKFVNAQTDKAMDPPFPEFARCENCKVSFFCNTALNGHECLEDEHKTCPYCQQKFSDLAYKLHIEFHLYTRKSLKPIVGTSIQKPALTTNKIPDLLKKYESLKSVWNILYSCEMCNTVLDDYDRVVEHCQDHFCSMENYNVIMNHCEICDLVFLGNCYEKHKELHTRNDVTKGSFKIILYNFDGLLSNTWLDIFNTLAKEQINLIMSKSVYKFARNVRMNVVQDGPNDLTLYQCQVCNNIIESNSVASHVINEDDCTKNPSKNSCTICGFYFNTVNYKKLHANLHSLRHMNSKSFKIVTFNDNKDAYVNDVLRTTTDNTINEDLKFIRCQYCGKLINKMKYRKHMYHHKTYDKVKKIIEPIKNHAKILPKLLVRPKFKNVELKNLYNFYTCIKCDLSVVSRKATKKHGCSMNKSHCAKCGLWINTRSEIKHSKYHDRYPKITKKNIHIIYFKDGFIQNNHVKHNPVSNIKVLIYQCERCSASLHKEVNVKKHVCSTVHITCKLCDLPFVANAYGYHTKLHGVKKFAKVNIVLIKFKDNVISKAGKATIAKTISNSEYGREVKNPVFATTTQADKKVMITQSSIKTKLGFKKNIASTNSPLRNADVSTPKTKNVPKLIPAKINEERDRKILSRHLASRFFKCVMCNLLFVSGSSLVEHHKKCREDNKAVRCNTCGLLFHSTAIAEHKSLQSNCDRDVEYNFVTLKVKDEEVAFHERNVIFLCSQCDVYNISLRGMVYHYAHNHTFGFFLETCKICDIKFSNRSYKTHQQLHHITNKLKLSDLYIATVDTMKLKEALNHLPDESELVISEYEPLQASDETVKRKHETGDTEIEPSIKRLKEEVYENRPNSSPSSKRYEYDSSKFPYRCPICNLHFIHKASIESHLSRGTHHEKQTNCPECGLAFTHLTLRKHLPTHKKNANKSGADQQKSIVKTEEIVTRKLMPKVTEVRVSEASSSKIIIGIKPNKLENNPNRDVTESNTQKLFKCSACDVYFLTSDMCLEHTTDHQALDPFEYIGCKICELQFMCESLGAHMRTHRDNTFSIDKLIVAEFQPGSGGIKIDTYSAADRLKAKLVSTTTHSDNEDENKNSRPTQSDVVTESDTTNHDVDMVSDSDGR